VFRRILIANRGEIAARVIRTCRSLGIETVAVHSEADRGSPHLREATKTICIGPARGADSYLRVEAILQAALQTDCQAVHPGYGFLSENALFAKRCLLQKLTFIGPPPGAITLMGDKVAAKQTLARLGLPTIPGSGGKVADAAEAARIAAGTGYPVLLKAASGGGGKGMRVARSESELLRAFPEASLEAEKAFSDPTLYVEKLIERARHIEFQVLVDSWGRAVHLGERECTLQRSHQKLVEETPSPAIGPAERDALGRKVAEALAEAGYQGAGTVEFLRGPDGAFYFMEVNARLQVEHPVTEMVTGIDLVEKQLRIAAGEPLGLVQDGVRFEGSAVEFRINAEDPDDGFRPDPGTITAWEPPRPAIGELLRFTTGPGGGAGIRLRLDSHVEAGYTVPPYYDSLLGKLIVHGPDRAAVLEAAARAVGGFRVGGVKTTLPLHGRILASEPFRTGVYDLTTLPAMLAGTGSGGR
jgi:acetyl-CoA carboxylase biotin carboxylase subunit